jgi:hypothetical protein
VGGNQSDRTEINMNVQHLETKVLVQHVSTRNYLGSQRLWVKSESEAHLFPNTLEAIDYCLAHRIRHVDIILKFPDPSYDIRLEMFSRLRTPANRVTN